MNEYALAGNIMGADLIFSGYIRCNICKTVQKLSQINGGCSKCSRRVFEYGVLHKTAFVSYIELKGRLKSGHKYIDGSHGGLPVSCEAFRIKNAVNKKRRDIRKL